MCLITIAFQQHANYKLLLAANRDEFYDRPTTAAHFWEQHPALLAGRDERQGGTWLGITRNGRLAAITNYREERPPPAPRSRGDLTLNFLTENSPALTYASLISGDDDLYNGYSLLLYDGKQLVACSNRHHRIEPLPPGLYGLSNHLLDTPWPKVQLAKANLKALLSNPTLTASQLLETLASRKPFTTDQLPDTGLSSRWERSLSPPFVDLDEYGTRCSTALLISSSEQVSFTESSFERGSAIGAPQHFEFQIER